MKGRRTCELCNQEASLYCPSDSAFLCSNCDATVHEANFLVARHLRYSICNKCNRFSTRRPTCLSCSPEKNIPSDSLTCSSSSAESSCATSTAKPSENNIKLKKKKNTTKKRRRSCSSSVTDDASSPAVEREGGSVFVKWSRELGLGENGDCVASLASHALVFCQGKWRALPFRVAAATSFWLGLIRFCGLHNQGENQNLTRLEAISGVPAKLILAAHAKLARVFTHRLEFHNSPQQQEGWDES